MLLILLVLLCLESRCICSVIEVIVLGCFGFSMCWCVLIRCCRLVFVWLKVGLFCVR